MKIKGATKYLRNPLETLSTEHLINEILSTGPNSLFHTVETRVDRFDMIHR